MTERDFDEFVALMEGIFCEVYQRRAPGDFVIQIWWTAFEGNSLQDIRAALQAHILDAETGQYLPKPADIKRHLDGTMQDQAMVAWGKVREAIRLHGGYYSVAFDDPVIHACLRDMGGWINLCHKSTESDLKFAANDFSKRYRAYAGQGTSLAFAPVLIGVFDAENQSSGYKADKPRLIGERHVAKAISRSASMAEIQAIKHRAPLRLAHRRSGQVVSISSARSDEEGR